ncbi:F-box/LRR-repeat protein 14-like [Actinia tenebrosa]|uniref:F-box/LRR-repeat protein 14-like n=1 Tax=Actinia tenebrosa TaxID=6105 RepID=A0A6P8HFN2_ACTTE|nr:F-box/LRR-repeat protein 14-like [Actinia tenebrosa]
MESQLHVEQGPLRGNILHYIFSFLDVANKQIVAQVCRYWKDIAYAPTQWQEITAILPYSPSESLIIGLKNRQVTRVSCSRSTDEELSFLFSQVPGLTYLKIDDSRRISHELLEKNLTALTGLEHLHISNCPQVSLERLYLNKSFAKVLKKLKSLKLPRKISPSDFGKLVSKLKNLEELDLYCIGFLMRQWKKLFKRDTIELVADNLPNLESLHFEHIQYLSHSTVTYVAKNLKKLKNLSFSGIQSQGMTCPYGFGYREDEEEDSNELDMMIKELCKLKDLESLKFEVSGDEISESEILRLVRNLPKLKELKIKAISKITAKHANQIANFLPNLSIEYCTGGKRINDKDLQVMSSGLNNLKSLTLQSNPGITDSGMQYIANFKSLTTLFLNGKVGDAGVAVLAKGLPQLQNLSFLGCRQIGDAGAIMIGKHLKKLQCLSAQKTKIGDEGFSFMCLNLPKLRSLDVSYCPITNQGIIDGAVGLGNLNSLEIGSQKISNDGFQKSAKFLKGLTYLRIVNCHLINKEGVISMLEDLPSLMSLTFSGCGYMCMQERLVQPLCDAAGVDLTVIDVE